MLRRVLRPTQHPNRLPRIRTKGPESDKEKRQGRVAEFWALSEDQDAVDEFFG